MHGPSNLRHYTSLKHPVTRMPCPRAGSTFVTGQAANQQSPGRASNAMQGCTELYSSLAERFAH
eukprot:975306-Lingulodinium_polyedra.AAC.1